MYFLIYRLSELVRNIRVHKSNKKIVDSTIKKLTCTYCGKQFKNEKYFLKHVHCPKIFICSKCNRRFKRKWELNVHYKAYHTNERNFKCEICGKGFLIKQLLKYHQARHAKDYKIKCAICKKGFYVMSAFKKHYAVHHEGL